MRRGTTRILAPLAVLALAACGGDRKTDGGEAGERAAQAPAASARAADGAAALVPDGGFRAALSGPVRGELTGEGFFCRGPEGFLMLLEDTPRSANLSFGAPEPAPPARGEYPLVEVDGARPGALWAFPVLYEYPGAGLYTFRLARGTISVTESSPDALAGSFRMELSASPAPWHVPDGEPVPALVTGAFRARYHERCGVPEKGGAP